MSEFRAIFGTDPAGRWSAPGRVNLIGEYTDVNEGHVLPFAIQQRTAAEAAPRGDRMLRLYSRQHISDGMIELDLDRPPVVTGWAIYGLAVARALEAAGVPLAGADVLFDGDVAIGAGLSSSAALECALAMALCGVSGQHFEPMELARIARRAENEYVGMPCGIMDQAAAMCCTAGHALLLDTRTLSARQVPLDLAAAGLSLLVVDSRVKHAHADSAYARRKASCDAAAAALGVTALRDVAPEDTDSALSRLPDAELRRRARHVLTEQGRVMEVVRLLDAGRPADIGPVLVAGHQSLRDDFEISTPELDTVVASALAAGALGARMTGGGFGGSVVVLVEAGAADDTSTAIRLAFRAKGFKPPAIFTAVPSRGAGPD